MNSRQSINRVKKIVILPPKGILFLNFKDGDEFPVFPGSQLAIVLPEEKAQKQKLLIEFYFIFPNGFGAPVGNGESDPLAERMESESFWADPDTLSCIRNSLDYPWKLVRPRT